MNCCPLCGSKIEEQKTTTEQKRFDLFWSAYPRKVGKKKCKEIWKRRNLDTLGDMIVADVTRRRIDDRQWSDGYIPNPQTYLNGDRWEDEIQTRRAVSATTDRSEEAWRQAIDAAVGDSGEHTIEGEFFHG